jgi:hypothetical protein
MSADQTNASTAPKTYTIEEVEKMVSGAVAKGQTELLAKLGAKSPEEVTAALGQLRANEDAQKSELQKLVERATKAEADAAGAKTYRERLAAYTNAQLAALPAAQRAVVEQLAGDDPVKIADTLALLGPTWQNTAATQAKTEQSIDAVKVEAAKVEPTIQPAAPKPAPAALSNAALPAGAPKPSTQKTKFEEWSGMSSPIAQSLFYQLNGPAIEASRPESSN